MLQNLTKGKMVEWVVLLVALVALGLSIAAVAKPCSSNFGDYVVQNGNKIRGILGKGEGMCKTPNSEQCGYFTKDMMCAKNFYCPSNNGNCISKDGSDLNLCDDGIGGGGNPGQQHECCNLDSGCSSTTHGGNLQCVPDSRCLSGYSCQPGKPPSSKCTSMGNPCGDKDDPPCCSGLTCFVGTCVRQSDVHKESEALKTHCTNNEDCAEVGGGVCLPDNKCSTFHQGQTGYIPGIQSGGKDAKSGGKNGLIGGGGLSRLDNIGGGTGLPSPSPSHSPSPSPSPSPGGDGKKSSDLPLILGIIGGSVGLVIVLAIAYLIVTKRLKL